MSSALRDSRFLKFMPRDTYPIVVVSLVVGVVVVSVVVSVVVEEPVVVDLDESKHIISNPFARMQTIHIYPYFPYEFCAPRFQISEIYATGHLPDCCCVACCRRRRGVGRGVGSGGGTCCC